MNDLIQFLRDNFSIQEVQFILSFLDILIIPVLLFFLTQQIAKRNKLEEQLNESKRKNYQKFTSLTTKIFTESGEPNPYKIILSHLDKEYYSELLLYGSPKVIDSFSDWYQFVFNNVDNSEKLPQEDKKNTGKICFFTFQKYSRQ